MNVGRQWHFAPPCICLLFRQRKDRTISQQHDFTNAWADFKPRDHVNVLAGDEDILGPNGSRRHVVLYDSWDDLVVRWEEFVASDARLHLSLLPQPFFGDLSGASVFILTLNPGLHPIDYVFRVPRP